MDGKPISKSALRTSQSPLLIQSLARVCRENPTREKVLITPSYHVGRQVLEALAGAAGGWLNLRLATPLSLALDAAASRLGPEGGTLASDSLRESILHTAYDATPKTFFPEKPTPGLLAAIRSTIEELRMTGVRPEDIQALHARDSLKAKDLAAILARYEKELSDAGALDAPAIFRLTLQDKPPSGSHFLIPESLRLSGLARRFLEAFTHGAALLLREDPVIGLEPPGGRLAAPDRAIAISPTSFLFAPDALPSDRPDIDIFAAVGERNECREVLGRLLASGSPFDQAEILLADYATYAPILDDLQKDLGCLPMTFGSGLPAGRSGPARALSGYARWIRDGFPESLLRRLAASGNLKTPDGLSGRRAARILRKSLIGWRVDRYAPCLNGHCQDLRRRLETAGEDESRERRAARLEAAVKTRDWVLDFLRAVPQAEAPFAEFLQAARSFLERHVAVRSEGEGLALAQLCDRLAEDEQYTSRTVSVMEAMERILAVAEGISVDASGPRPGRLHIAGLREGGSTGRPVTFVLGLDDLRFPGPTMQDPILADPERALLSPDLLTSGARSQEKLYSLAECLARLRGRLALSYPAFDLSDNRRRFPSSVLLQAHRLRTGDQNADYEALLRAIGQPVGFVSSGLALSPDDWWLTQIHAGGLLRDARASVLGAFPDLARGTQAEEARTKPEATPHDGKIAPDPERDPRRNRHLVVSASRLETYPACPRRYFLQYVLEVEPPEELAIEPGVWLDPMNRGSLLHEFYRRFLAELAGKRERPDPRTHLRRAEEVLAGVIAEYRELVPPPSEAVFTLEAEELNRSLKVFLQGETDDRSTNTPAYFEVSFGRDEAEGIPLRDPVEIALPGGAIQYRGMIDRIDRRPAAHEWEVWDYKTGSSRGYARGAYTAGGRQLQHALYALAAKAVLRGSDPEAQVVVSGYLFPTEKGRGESFPRDPARVHEALAVIDAILNLIRDGVFVGLEEKCRFCDYAALCGAAVKDRRKALERAGDPSLARLQEVLDHD